jgi:formyltetrahydrofolate-dependent phosphoribosylglycinamide formyltransferase
LSGPAPINAAVFASGSGSNFQALLDREGKGALWRTRLLVVDRPGAGAVERAERAGVRVVHVPVSGRDPAEVGEATLAALRAADVQVIFLAGYLRLVPGSVCGAFPHRILNVHPALLPMFGGKGMWGIAVHEAVLRAGARLTGATVHFVDERYDEGSILAQWPVPVLPGDDAPRLAARVLEVEHLLYPLAAQHLCRALAAGGRPAPLAAPHDTFDGTSLARLTEAAFHHR